MNQQGMRVTLDAAMRARDVSRPRDDADAEPVKQPAPRKPAKGERRRLGKRQARQQASRPIDNLTD